MEYTNVNLKQLKQAIIAHNKGIDVSFNENYNTANKLGTISARVLCRMIASSNNGDSRSKITIKHAIIWAQRMLPKGSGYASQDILPWFADLVLELKSL